VFTLSFRGNVPDLRNLMHDPLLSGQHLPLLLAFMGAGALYAVAVFIGRPSPHRCCSTARST